MKTRRRKTNSPWRIWHSKGMYEPRVETTIREIKRMPILKLFSK